jgi:hypothetical protein
MKLNRVIGAKYVCLLLGLSEGVEFDSIAKLSFPIAEFGLPLLFKSLSFAEKNECKKKFFM